MIERDLLIGCGSRRNRIINVRRSEWRNLVTLDNVASHEPDVLFDLSTIGNWSPGELIGADDGKIIGYRKRGYRVMPFGEDSFDELHGYEVLEHIGTQGDYRKLFAQFTEFWRVLKPGGLLCATCPSWHSIWAWGDPSHTRIISPATLVFLDQTEYTRQIGKTAMSDFRHIYKADFRAVFAEEREDQFFFALEAVKPSRISV